MSTDSPENTSPTAGRKTLRRVLMVVVPAVALITGGIIYWHGGRYVETDNAYIKATKIPVSAEVSGTIVSVPVGENQSVSAGQLLFRLDPEPFQLAVQQAESRLAQVRTDLSALKAGYREKQAEIKLARTRYAFAQREQKRQVGLADDGFVSASQLDMAEQSVELARQKIAALDEDLKRLAESLGGDVTKPIEAHPRYRTALAQLEQARLNLKRIDVRAPRAGIVSHLPNPGQYTAAGHTALALIVDSNIWIEANFMETDLTHIEPGQPVTVHVDTYPDQTWEGEVESVSPATGAEFSLLPAQNVTGNWVKVVQRVPVRIRLHHKAGQPPLRAGLSTIVKIDTGHHRSLSAILASRS